MSNSTIAHVPIGYTLTIICDELSDGTYVRKDQPGGSNQYKPAVLNAGTNVTIGPFNEVRYYEIRVKSGTPIVSVTQAGVYTSEDEAATTALFTSLFTTKAAKTTNQLPPLSGSATGTQIAAAYNDLITALVQSGVIDEYVP